MKRTALRIPGHREAVLEALRSEQHPPAGVTAAELRGWVLNRIDNGWAEGEAAVAAGLTVGQVREILGERPR